MPVPMIVHGGVFIPSHCLETFGCVAKLFVPAKKNMLDYERWGHEKDRMRETNTRDDDRD